MPSPNCENISQVSVPRSLPSPATASFLYARARARCPDGRTDGDAAAATAPPIAVLLRSAVDRRQSPSSILFLILIVQDLESSATTLDISLVSGSLNSVRFTLETWTKV